MTNFIDFWSMRKRAKRDGIRHSLRIKKAIKENLKDLISDSNIISSDGNKKIKIPLKFLDNYRFKHREDKNQEDVGQSDKDHNPGDAIAHDGSGRRGLGSEPADSEGEEIYEEEISITEIIQMMLEDLDLPWLEQKDSAIEVETEDIRFSDISEVGPLSNVDKKKTILENIKRNAKTGEPVIKNIKPEDLRYKVWELTKEYHSNAAVYFLMDRSGSMDEDKKYIAKSFFFWLAHFCKTKYKNVEIIFIAHDTVAKIVPEKNFFTISNSGGTLCSSAFKLALEHINNNHDPKIFNNYVFSFSDGDNWKQDNEECIKVVERLLEVCTAVGYGEINPDIFSSSGDKQPKLLWSSLHQDFTKSIIHNRFMTAAISKKEDIYSCLKQFLGINSENV